MGVFRMATSFYAIMSAVRSANSGSYGADARFGVKRSKNDTADGSTVNARLVRAPASLGNADMESAALHGVIIGGTAGAAYGNNMAVSGAAARSIVRGIMANADPVIDAPRPAVDAPRPAVDAPRPAVDADPAPSAEPPANGRKRVNA